MKKAEMGEHRRKYHALLGEARSAERKGLYHRAVELALSSWTYIDGMMQYERKYEEKDFNSLPAIDMILKYAPLLLDFQSLDKLQSLLKKYSRIDKNTSASMADKLAGARVQMRDAYRLWDHLERHPGTRQSRLRKVLGGDQDQWRTVAEAWDRLGLVFRTPDNGSYRLALSTRMGEIVSAKCPSCGEIAKAPKAMFLSQLTCPECGEAALFVIRPSEPVVDIGE